MKSRWALLALSRGLSGGVHIYLMHPWGKQQRLLFESPKDFLLMEFVDYKEEEKNDEMRRNTDAQLA